MPAQSLPYTKPTKIVPHLYKRLDRSPTELHPALWTRMPYKHDVKSSRANDDVLQIAD